MKQRLRNPRSKTYQKPPQEKTSWGGVATWYDRVVEDESSYQQALLLPNIMRVLHITPQDRVVELACGQGFFSRACAEAGATVVASDIAPELIELARAHSPQSISFHVAPADKNSFVADGSVDVVLIVLALQNIERAEAVMREASRMVKDGGRFVIVLNHPAYRIPGYSDWGYDEGKRVQYRRTERYMTEYKHRVAMHPGADPTEVTYSFHRPLQLYVKHLSRAGFAITHLEEWVSHRVSSSGPRAGAENKARKEFPLFMCIEATKFPRRD